MPFEPAFDLTDDAVRGCRDEMDMTSEHRLTAAHACVLGETMRELLVDPRVTRPRVAAPCLVRVP